MPGWALLLSLLGTATADVLDDFSLEQMLAYVPRQTPTFCLNFAHSPAIDYAEAPNIVQQAGKGRVEWTWDAASPDSITDTISGTTFPNNETETVQRPMTSAAGLATSVTYFKARTPAHIKNNYMRTTNRADAPPRRYYYSMYEDALYLGGCIAAQQLDYLRSEPRRAHSCGPAAESNRPPWALRKSCGALRLSDGCPRACHRWASFVSSAASGTAEATTTRWTSSPPRVPRRESSADWSSLSLAASTATNGQARFKKLLQYTVPSAGGGQAASLVAAASTSALQPEGL